MSKNQTKKKPDPKAAEEKVADQAAEPVEAEIVEEKDVVDPIDALNQEIDSLQAQLTQSKTDLLRAYADTDNTRKRLQREAEQAKKYRFQSAALELLPILDNLNRALAAKPDNPEVQNYVRGFEMIQTQLVNALANEGVQEIDALNQPFDANFMQALATEKKEGVEPGIVTDVMQKGYKLKDRMLRPALVKVSE
ncbi:nucleotide exchange factor GrpE [Erysipelotrichaceae bacterium 51-3]